MELIEKLFRLLVDKVPHVIAETMLSLFFYIFRPYRAVVRMIMLARRKKIPLPFFTTSSFSLFLIAFGFGEAPENLIRRFSANDNYIDTFYVMLYSLGLVTFTIFLSFCIEPVMSARYKVPFRKFYYIVVALSFPWVVAAGGTGIGMTYSIMNSLLASDTPSWAVAWLLNDFLSFRIRALVIALLLILLSTAPLLIFAIQFDWRWYRKSSRFRRVQRIGVMLLSVIAIMGVAPYSFFYLVQQIRHGDSINYVATCFQEHRNIFITVSAENTSRDTKFIEQFDIYAYNSYGRGYLPALDKYVMTVSDRMLFDGLKENLVIAPKATRLLRFQATPTSETLTFSGTWSCSVGENQNTSDSWKWHLQML